MKLIYISELTKFLVDSKIKKICDSVKKLESTTTLTETLVSKIFVKNGFKKIGILSGSARVFTNDEIIIKIGGVTAFGYGDTFARIKKTTPKQAIPTIISFVGNGRIKIRIQPIANVDEKSLQVAYKKLENARGMYKYDFHSNNVAMFRGKPVLIDW